MIVHKFGAWWSISQRQDKTDAKETKSSRESVLKSVFVVLLRLWCCFFVCFIYSLVYICACIGESIITQFLDALLGIISLRHIRPGPSCVFNHIRGRTAVYCNSSGVHKFSHCCVFQTCRTFAVMFCVFDLRYLQLQQNLFMLSIKKYHTLPLACHLLARRRPPTFFISWVGCVDICVSWSTRLRYPIESTRTCIYNIKKAVRCQELLGTCVFFHIMFSSFFNVFWKIIHAFEANSTLEKR